MQKIVFLKRISVRLFISFFLFTSYGIAMESAPGSGTFHYFRDDEGSPSQLHDPFYTHEEVGIVENMITQLSAPRSLEKDELIAFHLVKKIKENHLYLLLEATKNYYCFIPRTSLPESDNLQDLARHALYGRKFLCFGRNRTFEVLKDRLKWVDSDDKVMDAAPAIFKNIYEKARREVHFF